MKVALLNQFFFPDLSATAQIATDLAEDLVTAGFEVTAIAAQGSYLGSGKPPSRERYRGIEIRRFPATSLGKKTLLHRALDYGSFYATALAALAAPPRYDVLISLTTPPLIAAAGLIPRKLKGTRLVYWVQDLYPEVAFAFDVLKESATASRALVAISREIFKRSDRVVVLGERMKERAVLAGAASERTLVIPNWSDDANVQPIEHAANPLRAELAGDAKLVAMYSGNIGRGHDVQTLIAAAKLLKDRREIAFVFQGEGARKSIIAEASKQLPNLKVLPYQPRERLAQSLSAGDVHLISLDQGLDGLLEPSKLYGVMSAGRPAVFVGPARSEVALTLQVERCGEVVANGDGPGLAGKLLHWLGHPKEREAMGQRARAALLTRYSRQAATGKWVRMVTELA